MKTNGKDGRGSRVRANRRRQNFVREQGLKLENKVETNGWRYFHLPHFLQTIIIPILLLLYLPRLPNYLVLNLS